MSEGTTYILGAGASRFARFPTSNNLQTFLRDAYNFNKQLVAGADAWLRLMGRLEERIAPASPNIETLCTLVDLAALDSGIASLIGLSIGELETAPYALSRLIAAVFTHHSHRVMNQIFKNVPERLELNVADVIAVMDAWAKILNEGDVIVTFNWDLVHEMILAKAGKWWYATGYGFTVSEPQKSQSPVTILKLHGSCNWSMRHPRDPNPHLEYVEEFFNGDCPWVDLDSTSRLETSADYGYSLIQPSYLKDPSGKPALLPIWAQAANAITTAKKVTVLGYSLPLADSPTRTLLSSALSRNQSLKELEIVLGDTAEDPGYRHWRDFCSSVGKIARPTYKTFEKFVLAK
jgi:hypothetical protein